MLGMDTAELLRRPTLISASNEKNVLPSGKCGHTETEHDPRYPHPNRKEIAVRESCVQRPETDLIEGTLPLTGRTRSKLLNAGESDDDQAFDKAYFRRVILSLYQFFHVDLGIFVE